MICTVVMRNLGFRAFSEDWSQAASNTKPQIIAIIQKTFKMKFGSRQPRDGIVRDPGFSIPGCGPFPNGSMMAARNSASHCVYIPDS